MITYILIGHAFCHEVQTTIQIFYPNEKYRQAEQLDAAGTTVVSTLTAEKASAAVYEKGCCVAEKEWEREAAEKEAGSEGSVLKKKKQLVMHILYFLLKAHTGYQPPWGILTGIRPAKLAAVWMLQGETEAAVIKKLVEQYDAAEAKANLTVEVAKAEEKILERSSPKESSLYIGIPFCPTRCLYCSFTSYPIAAYQNHISAYIDALLLELEYIQEWAQEKPIKTIYIGGGTPTSLAVAELERILAAVAERFIKTELLEYTVEAGRPDTITPEKLAVLKKYGVTRISINPQTMNDKTLAAIGRQHNVSDIKRVFGEAREAGHQNINMDLIVGLPGEGLEDITHTMQEICELAPENVTVHTLAVKRASRLRERLSEYQLPDGREIEAMLLTAEHWCRKHGLLPYYMYRQKNMVGSFENVGYAKRGFEGIYNVEIMEERQSIFAAGAGATTKLYDEKTDHLERIFNVKNVEEYISRIDEMIQRKRNWREMHYAPLEQ